MKGIKKTVVIVLVIVLGMTTIQMISAAKGTDEKIKNGIYIDSIDVSGMSYDEAYETILELADKKSETKVSIIVNKETVETTLGSLGYKWSNESVIDEAVQMGKSGSIIKRYKDDLDLKNQGKKFPIKMGFDKDVLKKNLEKKCDDYNVVAQNASLKATGSGFEIIPEQDGCEVDYDTTTDGLYKYVSEEWDGKSDITYTATTQLSKAEYTVEDCEKVSNTPMGSFTTTFSTGYSYDNRNMNIKNGAEKIDGNVLYPGETFSCNEHLAPWTEDNGWYPAGTYVDGGVQDSLGGGICQVSSTLYNALLRAEIEIVERYPHSMSVSYVDLSADAALAGDYKDLVFKNNTDAPIYVQGIYSAGGSITFNIYGHDTRDAGHSVEYISETTSTTPIKTEVEKDDSKPKGYKETVSTGHVGYSAKLWKVTYENGVEVSREVINTSSYRMSPTKVIEGTGKSEDKDDNKKNNKDKDKKDTEEETKKTEDAEPETQSEETQAVEE